MQALAPITPKFWLQEQVSEEQFIQKADTFDILLFKTRTNAAKVTRAWTKSEFGKQLDPSCATSHSNLFTCTNSCSNVDHAAMVIRYEGEDNVDKIYYLEATSDEGVVMKSFDNTRQNIGEFFEKIVWRRLNYCRTHESIAKINKFVQ